MRRSKIRLPGPTAAVAAILAAGPVAAAPQAPNTTRELLRQCEAYVAEDAEDTSRMTCENTIWSTLKAMDFSKRLDPAFRPPYCKPEGTEISVRQGADLFVTYVNENPELLQEPAEKAVILAIRHAYPCAL
jgi:hypothetical protein